MTTTRIVSQFTACIVEQEPRAGFALYEDGEFVCHVQTTSQNARTLKAIRNELERLFVTYRWPVWRVARMICEAGGFHPGRKRRGVGRVWHCDTPVRSSILVIDRELQKIGAAPLSAVDRVDLLNGRHLDEVLDRVALAGVDSLIVEEAREIVRKFHSTPATE